MAHPIQFAKITLECPKEETQKDEGDYPLLCKNVDKEHV